MAGQQSFVPLGRHLVIIIDTINKPLCACVKHAVTSDKERKWNTTVSHIVTSALAAIM